MNAVPNANGKISNENRYFLCGRHLLCIAGLLKFVGEDFK